MDRWARLGVVLVPLLGACAGRAGFEPPLPPTPVREPPSPARIYTVGEEQFERGRYVEAVELWRRAVVELPPTPDFDELRHQLVLRLGYGQLMAWHQTRDAIHLHDAKQMLERYLERHEQLFGEDDRAAAERGEVYELLYVVEQELEPPGDAVEVEDQPTVVAERSGTSPSDDDGYVEDGEFHRTVVVGRKVPSVDDPQMRRKLASAFTDPFADTLVLTAPGWQTLHGPRPLLRAGGLARPAESEPSNRASRKRARVAGRSLLAAARPALKECYEQAFARSPVPVATSTVEISIDDAGQVSEARIVDGGLVDMIGDLCMVEQLEATRLVASEGESSPTAVRIELPLTFFYQGEVVCFESGEGRCAPTGVAGADQAVPGASPAPAPGPDGSSIGSAAKGA